MGSTKSQNFGKHIDYFIRYVDDKKLSKTLLDDVLQLFVVLYLKSNDKVKQLLISDLESVFCLIKSQQTKFFIEKNFKYNIMFYNIS